MESSPALRWKFLTRFQAFLLSASAEKARVSFVCGILSAVIPEPDKYWV